MTCGYVATYTERSLRCVNFVIRWFLGLELSYDYLPARSVGAVICAILVSLCRAIRLSNLPSPSEVTTVYGAAQRDVFMRYVMVLGNVLGIVSYPFEVCLLLEECHVTSYGRYVLDAVNLSAWIVWSSLEFLRWSKMYMWASNILSYENDASIRILLHIAVTSLAQNAIDLVIAINWLPVAFLWANMLPSVIVGFIGTISSILALFKIHLNQKKDIIDAEEDAEGNAGGE